MEVAILVKTGFFFLVSEPPAKRTASSTIMVLSNLTSILLKLAVRASSVLYLILQIYSYKAVGIGYIAA